VIDRSRHIYSFLFLEGRKRTPLKRNSFGANLKLIRALESLSESIPCDEGSVLFKQGDAPRGIYILESGEAALTLDAESGRTVMCLAAGSGSLLGIPAIVDNQPYSMTAMVRRGSVVRFVSRENFDGAMRAEPSLYLDVLGLLAAEVRTARHAFSER
jgi:CRP-like cAMP-binding protein